MQNYDNCHLTNFLRCSTISSAFVLSLYVWPESRRHLYAAVDLTEAATNVKYYYDRNHPTNIIKRSISISFVGACGLAYLASSHSNIKSAFQFDGKLLVRKYFINSSTLMSILTSLGITCVLFSGVIATKVLYPDERTSHRDSDGYVSDSEDGSYIPNSEDLTIDKNPSLITDGGNDNGEIPDVAQTNNNKIHFYRSVRRDISFLLRRRRLWKKIRNFIISPFVEEIIFRAVMWKVVTSNGIQNTPINFCILAAAFGVAHIHHILINAINIHRDNLDLNNISESRREAWRKAVIITVVQSLMTATFSVYNTTIFVYFAKKNLLSATLVHALCNYLGPPSTSYLSRQDRMCKYNDSMVYIRSYISNSKKGLQVLLKVLKRNHPSNLPVKSKTVIISASYIIGILSFLIIIVKKYRCVQA
eukprot:Tbor_TRINITY_DN3832_c0_g1::TRINITY_DN3832_c0_g1_i2::g.5662::m.5662/K08658/RCE1, FACE2; prenyl protein peptidase